MNKHGITDSITVGEMHPLFKGIKWVLSARSSDDTRAILMTMKVERDDLNYQLIATDGRRLHVSTYNPGMFDDDIEVLDPGLYEMIAAGTKYVVLAKESRFTAERYPNWRAVMPENTTVSFSERLSSDRLSLITLRTGVVLANTFACAAVGFGTCFKKDDLVNICFGLPDPSGPVVIKHEFGKAFVMPIRIIGENEEHEESSEEEQTPDIPEVANALAPLIAAMEGGDKIEVSVGGAVAFSLEKDSDLVPITRTAEEEQAYQEGRTAYDDGESRDENPYRADVPKVQRLNAAWFEGWEAAFSEENIPDHVEDIPQEPLDLKEDLTDHEDEEGSGEEE